jgi:hypothetical protein
VEGFQGGQAAAVAASLILASAGAEGLLAVAAVQGATVGAQAAQLTTARLREEAAAGLPRGVAIVRVVDALMGKKLTAQPSKSGSLLQRKKLLGSFSIRQKARLKSFGSLSPLWMASLGHRSTTSRI